MFKELKVLLMGSERKKHLRELYGNHYILNDSSIKEIVASDSEIIEYFKNNPDILKQREEEWQKAQMEKYEAEELKRKEMIKDRIFAYDYEETVFKIYAPLAKYIGGGWYCSPTEALLPKEDIVAKISQYRNVSPEEACNIFEGLRKHNILIEFRGKFFLSLINSISGWDVVSDTDMNLDKWMVAHGYKHK